MHPLVALLPTAEDITLIRVMRASDCDDFQAYRSDVEVARYQGWSTITLEDARAFIDEMTTVSGLRRGEWIQLAIADARSNQILGDMGLYLEADESAAEIGFTLSRQAQGRGHASTAVRLALYLIFAASTVPVVRAVTDARNAGSIRVLERTCFVRSSTRPAVFKGESCTELLYVHHRPDA